MDLLSGHYGILARRGEQKSVCVAHSNFLEVAKLGYTAELAIHFNVNI